MEPLQVGRYFIHDEIAAGGMATVHIGRLMGPVGFARTVAIKRLHAQYAKEPEFVAMFIDEARLAARIRHPNVVPTLDVVALGSDLLLVMEYVQGESVARLLRTPEGRRPIPPTIAATVVCEMLLGLHAAHEAKDDQGNPLFIVHRDVSPQNLLVGVDGVARVVDFGVAKAAGRLQSTREGETKGKAAYMAPEQLLAEAVDRRTDVYAAGVVLWEMLTAKRLFVGDSPQATMQQVLRKVPEPPSTHVPNIPAAVDALVLRAMERNADDRFATAREMAMRLEDIMGRESSTRIGEWVQANAGTMLQDRAERIARIESESSGSRASPPVTSIPDEVSTELVPSLTGTSSAAPPRARRGGRSIPVVYVAAAAVACAFAIVSTVAYQAGTRRDATPSAPAAVPTATSVSATPSTTVDTAPPPAPPSSATPVAPATATPVAPVVSAHAPATAPARPAARPHHTAPPEPAAGDCSPPYTLDGNGYHIPKPQCL